MLGSENAQRQSPVAGADGGTSAEDIWDQPLQRRLVQGEEGKLPLPGALNSAPSVGFISKVASSDWFRKLRSARVQIGLE